MDELCTISLLLDFYGQLVTKRQYDILDLYYNGDYSLGEIAEELNISRQGVYDSIKRGKAALFEMEKKLGLVSRFNNQREKVSKVFKIIDGINTSNLTDKDKNALLKAKQVVRHMMED